jgi:hypothetical protein
LVLTLVSGTLSVVYLFVGKLASGISTARRRKFHSAGTSLIAFTILCLAKYLTHAST